MMRIEVDCLHLGIVAVDAGPQLIALTLTDRARRKIRSPRDPLYWNKARLLYEIRSTGLDISAAIRELLDVLRSQLRGSDRS